MKREFEGRSSYLKEESNSKVKQRQGRGLKDRTAESARVGSENSKPHSTSRPKHSVERCKE